MTNVASHRLRTYVHVALYPACVADGQKVNRCDEAILLTELNGRLAEIENGGRRVVANEDDKDSLRNERKKAASMSIVEMSPVVAIASVAALSDKKLTKDPNEGTLL